MEADAAELRDFALMPLPEQRARIDELAAAEATPREQRLLGRLQRSRSRLRKGLESAPFETALARGVIDTVTPLDFDYPESLAARATQAETIAAAYGMTVSPLRPAEARSLEARLDQTAPEALPELLAGLRPEFGNAALAEVARGFETARPHLAVALSLAEGRPEIAADIIEGGRCLKQAAFEAGSSLLSGASRAFGAHSTTASGAQTTS